MEYEISHGRGITWMLQARQAPQHIAQSCISTSLIVEVTATGSRDGRPL